MTDATDEPRATDVTEATEVTEVTDVTVVGLGAMGSALAEAFLRAGHRVTVWNRTPSRAEPLLARGAHWAGSGGVAEAVAASPLTVVCLVDQKASRQVLSEPAVAAALSGRTLVDLTSDTPERAREAADRAASHGVAYLDGAVMVPTVVVGSPEALLLFSGSREAFDTHRAVLSALGGDLRFLGQDPGAAALHDLALLDVFWSMMAAAVHAFALVTADGVRAEDFAPLAVTSVTGLAPLLTELATEIDEGTYPGELANLVMDAAAAAHVVEASRTRGLDTSVIDAVHGLMARAIAAGHGGDGFSRVVDVVRAAGGADDAAPATPAAGSSAERGGRRG
ncbi:NAD(P)-dependent oxidoreductase [Streptomyces sp. 4N509B]|uniref:NAD(P)-dependent oxidoreductase n=1 Tax=Streptomyces sp. 4N509B TaxID=3457413 RepID=UPI003FD44D25